MSKCCATCNKQFVLHRYDYSEGGCNHSMESGYVCSAFAHEGIMVHMIGSDPKSAHCEMWSERKE